MINFKGQNAIEFYTAFNSEDKCKEYLADIKWENGYECVKCKNETYQKRLDHSRTCNKCSHTESASANGLFHKVKFGLENAFVICFEMATTTQSLSAMYMGKRLGITRKQLDDSCIRCV